MGLLDNLTAALGGGSGSGGGQQQLQRFAAGDGDFASIDSADHAGLATMVQHAPPGVAQQVFSDAARNADPQAYASHVDPAGGGAHHMGSLKAAALGAIAGVVVNKLVQHGVSHDGLLSRIPGLNTTDPSQMNPGQVSQLLQYVQQNHPDVLGQAAAEVGQQQPNLLGSMLGQGGLAEAAKGLAAHFLK